MIEMERPAVRSDQRQEIISKIGERIGVSQTELPGLIAAMTIINLILYEDMEKYQSEIGGLSRSSR